METGKTVRPYPAELRELSVRMVREQAHEHGSEWAAKVGCTAETLRQRVRQAERDRGERAGLTSEERSRLKGPERESRELLPEPTRSRGRRARILRRRSSPARRSHDRLHRRSSCGPRAEPSRRHRSEPDGEGRSAARWRSPRRPAMRMPRAGPTRRRPRRGHVATACSAAMSGGSGRRTSGSTACARSGASSVARGSRLRAARSRV